MYIIRNYFQLPEFPFTLAMNKVLNLTENLVRGC